MAKYICTTCGVQYPDSYHRPDMCIICSEERQYINPKGQEWTTLEKIRTSGIYQNEIVKVEDGLYSIRTTPKFGIGQTAYLVLENGFNLLWDCISLLDQTTIDTINDLGGIDAIALSHPHYYSTQVEWAITFNAPIYLHKYDKEWITFPSKQIKCWSGDQLRLTDQLVLNRLGGHYKGGAVLNWVNGNNSKGVLLTGDIIQVVADTNWVSFMYSYPNLIPLPSMKVKEIASRVKYLHFDRIYNAFSKVVQTNGKEVVQNSATRYIEALSGTLFDT